jgi:hypothetical protein
LCYHSIWATFSRSVLDGDRVTRVSGSYGGGEKATKRSSILVKPRMSSYETNKACISLSEQYCAVHCRTWKYLAPKYCVPSHIISEAKSKVVVDQPPNLHFNFPTSRDQSANCSLQDRTYIPSPIFICTVFFFTSVQMRAFVLVGASSFPPGTNGSICIGSDSARYKCEDRTFVPGKDMTRYKCGAICT